MQKFLDKYVEFHLNNKNGIIDQSLIILPSKRSVSALKTSFANHSDSLWLPQIIDIVSFIENITELEIIDHNQSLLEFYMIYKDYHSGTNVDTFENFHSWASTLIGDFNEIDRFLVDTDSLFTYNKALKEINYFGERKTDIIKSYIRFWENMPNYYNNLKTHLLDTNKAYQGLAYRMAAKNIDKYLSHKTSSITFLGFNALNAAEEHIIESCLKAGIAKVVWDIDRSYLSEAQHPSNTFIKRYKNTWKAYEDSIVDLNINSFKDNKNIEILSSPKNVGQVKSVADILKKMNDSEIENTAIILNDENLLNPILNSIPGNVDDVNITMGLSLKQTPISDFFTKLVEHQKTQTNSLQFKFLTNLFEHNLLKDDKFSEKQKILEHLKTNKLKEISFSLLSKKEDIGDDFFSLINCLNTSQKPIDFIDNLNNLTDVLLGLKSKLYKNYLLAFKNIFQELKLIFETHTHLSMMSFIILFKEKLENEKLSFKGSKTKGLQIMGMLETRLLDFKNIILTSVNEGVLPSGKTDNSYIPFNLKKEYGLPTYAEKDAIYAYHFFRLLQRSKNCYLIYDNDQSGFNKGEKSRFITYLEVFNKAQHQITTHQFSLSTSLKAKDLMEIEKTPEIMNELYSLAKSGFSPTALTTYILNPVLFYKRYVLHITENEEIEDVINHKDFGTLIHDTIETLYNNSGLLNAEKIDRFKKETEELLKLTFDKIYAIGEHDSGANKIQIEIAKAYLMKFYDYELYKLKRSQTEIVGIEVPFKTNFKTSNHSVVLKGKIDRVDKHEENLRIIDLKTGKVENKNLKFDDLEDLISDFEYSKAFQILFYALVYSKTQNKKNILAGIISFKNLRAWFMPLEYNGKKIIDDEMLGNFEEYLSKLIEEILNPDIPFKEKEVNFKS